MVSMYLGGKSTLSDISKSAINHWINAPEALNFITKLIGKGFFGASVKIEQ